VITRRAERGTSDVGKAVTGKGKSEADQLSWQFWSLLKVTYRVAAPSPDAVLTAEMFETAQWGQSSEAGASLAQMSARGATDKPELAGLVRERQDLVGEWQARDAARNAAVSRPPEKRNLEAEAANARRLREIDTRIGEIDEQLTKDFPDYAALVSPKPLPITDVQSQLRDGEALLLFLDTPVAEPTPEETFIWVVTKTVSRWVRSELGTQALTDKVQALRCGMDDAEWEGIEKPARCAKLLGVGKPGDKEPLPFSFAIAHDVYQGLFGQVADLIKDKHLLIVPSGPLTSLPFQVLVTEAPQMPIGRKYEDYREVAWLARERAITVLPSVASLKSLRTFARGSPGSGVYMGYGNPDLAGNPECRPAMATVEVCPNNPQLVHVADAASSPPRTARGRGGRRSAGLDHVFRNGSGQEAVLTEVRALCPLPDTAQEIRCVAKSLGVPDSEIHLGAMATEADIKVLNDSGKLATYKVIHFATHGLLAGDVAAMAKRQGEPALVLTPPKTPKDADDDGLLTASEVTRLKLNADWVILSACNTAAGEKLGAEAFSGLARAFFYAGARALLVSHWPVYSDAAVRLITDTFDEMKVHPEIGRAEAQRRAMVALMSDPSQEDNAHPSIWAPFVVVGEGGTAAR
jgi:CHAT domain-containing protein